MENVDISVKVTGMDEVKRIADELQESVEKTKALASALVAACDNLTVNVN